MLKYRIRNSEVTKQKILGAALRNFADKGLYGARVDEISELSGINKRMIYAYFGSKEKLYVAVLEKVYASMAIDEQQLLNVDMSPEETVVAIIEHYFRWLSINPDFVRMVMWENLNYAECFKNSDAPKSKGVAIDLLRKKIKQGIEEGVFREDINVDETVMSINLVCFSYFSNIYTMALLMDKNLGGEDKKSSRIHHLTTMVLRHLKK